MPLKYVVPGAVGGLASFAFSRVMIEPLIGAAVDFESVRAHADGHHDHGHELFSRSIQENVGAAVGIVVFGVVMGVLFAVAYATVRAALERHGLRPDPTALALLLAAGMWVAVALLPGLKYSANPPGVGLEDTVQERTSAFLTITVISVAGACAAVAAGLACTRRWGPWRAGAAAVAGYGAVMLCAMAWLPGFHETPDGFPAELLADFRVYSLANQALMWLAIGVAWTALARWPAGDTNATPRVSAGFEEPCAPGPLPSGSRYPGASR